MDNSAKPRIEVAVAIIRRGDCFLVAKRPKNKAGAGKWEFPGGKIEPLESPEECLVREIQEEFGASVLISESLAVLDYEYPEGGKFRFHCYLCEIPNEEPKALEHEEIAWVEAKNLAGIDLLEADKQLIPLIQKKAGL
ncbi:MAG: (deoxy)nucleoside triphosphate pyrophosphohydrolase [Candidatus Wildermuthbacteria bacterium]|nr:(deoxy)nucleoside triphosphate pyrophosphohydrolase [Candidatus Wildermuthbacteria bacterium]